MPSNPTDLNQKKSRIDVGTTMNVGKWVINVRKSFASIHPFSLPPLLSHSELRFSATHDFYGLIAWIPVSSRLAKEKLWRATKVELFTTIAERRRRRLWKYKSFVIKVFRSFVRPSVDNDEEREEKRTRTNAKFEALQIKISTFSALSLTAY